MNQEKLYIFAPVFIAVIGLTMIAAPGQNEPADITTEIVTPSSNIHSQSPNVYVKIDRDQDQEYEEVYSTHNVLMEGEEAIESQIKSGSAVSWDYLSLGHGATPTDSDTTLDTEWASCGLSQKQATTVEDTGDGAWNLTATWTSTCDDVVVNTSAQLSTGASTSIDYFAGAYLGRDINLYTDDQITVEWANNVTG